MHKIPEKITILHGKTVKSDLKSKTEKTMEFFRLQDMGHIMYLFYRINPYGGWE